MLKLGVIGGGKWGQNHLKDLSRMNCCELVGLADPDPSKKTLADQYHLKHFLNYQDLLPFIDAVTLVTPTTTHYEIARRCLEQGKHVFVEKPLCFNLQESKELLHLAEERGLILSVGYVFRFNPLVKRLKELLPEIGEIQYISGRYIHSTVPPRQDSGVIFNLAVHFLDLLNYALPHPPKKLFCQKTNYLSPHQEDSAFISLNYGSFNALIETSCCHPLKERDMWVIASKEKLYLNFLDQVMIRYPILVSEKGTVSKEALRDPKIEKTQPLFEELWHFCQVCNQKIAGQPPQNHSAENPLTTELCLLALQSAKEDKILNLE